MQLKIKVTTGEDHDKYITTRDFNMLTSESSTARLAQGNLASKSGIADFIRKKDLNKHKLNELSQKVQAASTKRLTKDLINKFGILNEAKYFSSGIFQNYLVFIPAKRYIKYFSDTTRIGSWKFIGISEENIEKITKAGSNFASTFVDHHVLPNINFIGR